MKPPITTPTLPALLRILLAELERAYDQEGAARNGMPSVDLWANLLRCLSDTGVDRRSLPALLRLSTRALRTRIAFAVRQGWVEEQQLDRGRTVVLLTARGSAVSARWRPLQAAAEEQARAQIGVPPEKDTPVRLGAERAGKLRSALEAVVVRLPLEHPHYPASYGLADASITGGPGQDWKAVPRTPGGSVSDLPVLALVSQVLVAFAMCYEEKSPVALSLSADVIRRIPPEGRAVRGLGNPIGISALARHGFVSVTAIDGTDYIRLTAKGAAVSEAYDERIAAVESEWRGQFGDGVPSEKGAPARLGVVTALRTALRDAAAVIALAMTNG